MRCGLVAAAAWSLTGAIPAAAQAGEVDTPAEFITAWQTPGVTEIVLTADLTLPCADQPRGATAAALTLHGGGHRIRMDCTGAPQASVLNSQAAASLTVNDVTLSGGDAAVDGGGILAEGDLTINNSTITGNVASQDGGGVFSFGALTMDGATVTGNLASAGFGGAVTYDEMTINDSTIADNSAVDVGGGVGAPVVTIDNSTIAGNSTPGTGGGVFADSLTMDGTTVTGNTAGDGGGGVHALGGVSLDRSTLSGNTATTNGAGAVLAESETTVTQSTVTGNTGNGTLADLANRPAPGGIATDSLTLIYATVADNSGSAPGAAANVATTTDFAAYATAFGRPGGRPNCDNAGDVISGGHNATDDGSCGLSTGTDQTAVADIGLRGLADNGGPTRTMLPAADSPLVDHIADCPAGPGATISTDQRGRTRPQGGGCDIGSVETAGGAGGGLAVTGAPVRVLLATAGALLVTGLLLLLAVTRRRHGPPWRVSGTGAGRPPG